MIDCLWASELGVVAEHVRALTHRRGGIVVIEGGPGSGKTTLLKAVGAMADEHDVASFAAGCDSTSRTMPFAPLVDALLTPEESLLDPRTLRRLRTLADAHTWFLQELEMRLTQQALERPVVIAIDDLGHADDATLHALRALPERLSEDAVLWIAALEPGQAVHTRRRLEDLGATIVHLYPPGEGLVDQVAGGLLGAPPGGPLRGLTRALGARPTLLVELLERLRDADLVGVADGRAVLTGSGPPEPLNEIVANNVRNLSHRAREVVRVASIIGPRCTPQHLSGVLGCSPAALIGPLQEAVRSGLLTDEREDLAFADESLRGAVADTILDTVRRALRRQVVATLEQGAPATIVAPLLVEMAEDGEPVPVDRLVRTIDEVAVGSPSAAAGLGMRALASLPVGDPPWHRLTVQTIAALARCGRDAEARALADALVAHAGDPAAAASSRLAIASACAETAPTEAVGQTVALLRLAGVPEAMRLQANLLLATVRCAERRHAEALRCLPRSGAESTGPDLSRAWVHLACGQAGKALPELDLGVAQHAGLPDGPRWYSARARTLLSLGRLAEARADAETAIERFGGVAGILFTAHAWHVLATVAVHTDDAALAADAGAVAEAMMAADGLPVRRAGTWIAARLAIVGGANEVALELLSRLTRDLAGIGPTFCFPDPPWELLTVRRMLLAAGDHEGPHAVAVEAARRAALNDGLREFAAVAAHLRALGGADAHALAASVAELASLAGPVVGAEAAEDAAAALHQDRGLAARHLDTALQLFEEAGAVADAQRIACASTRLQGEQRPLPGWRDLTRSELAVVHAVARGATNKAAAAELYLSPHTVNSHLRSAFRKLGIHSRVELAALCARRATGTQPTLVQVSKPRGGAARVSAPARAR